MKRSLFGAGLLAALLLGGILVSSRMCGPHRALSGVLSEASGAAAAENWDRAGERLHAARAQWRENWHFSAAFSDHEPMEEIDSLFAQAEVFLSAGDGVSLATVCAQLSSLTEAMADANAFTWWNLL